MGSLPNLETPPQTSRISTVVPATPRGEENSAYNLNYMDLLMKLHYIRSISFFNSNAVQNLSISDLKAPMFPLLDSYSHVSGRVRISESGRPFIKCNDAGVRIAELHCEKTLHEWLDEKEYSIDELVHDHVLGPDLAFSPLVFVKVRKILNYIITIIYLISYAYLFHVYILDNHFFKEILDIIITLLRNCDVNQ